ncbi:hypothetical protein, partial [Propionibacterium sp.]|uniref:hypothetical protein n=1 Tax=Propionibacterium sp. TaxID=1977903 RepID=UPI0039EBA8A5
MPQFWSLLRSGMGVVGSRPGLLRGCLSTAVRTTAVCSSDRPLTGLWQGGGGGGRGFGEADRGARGVGGGWGMVR